jgi:hypothetical protein
MTGRLSSFLEGELSLALRATLFSCLEAGLSSPCGRPSSLVFYAELSLALRASESLFLLVQEK